MLFYVLEMSLFQTWTVVLFLFFLRYFGSIEEEQQKKINIFNWIYKLSMKEIHKKYIWNKTEEDDDGRKEERLNKGWWNVRGRQGSDQKMIIIIWLIVALFLNTPKIYTDINDTRQYYALSIFMQILHLLYNFICSW